LEYQSPPTGSASLTSNFLTVCFRKYITDQSGKKADQVRGTGITLKQGSHVAVPSGIIQRSSEHYANPEAFDGFRFVKRAAAGAKDSRLVDLSPDYLVFGMGAHAWYVLFLAGPVSFHALVSNPTAQILSADVCSCL
jgi:hypothetical protein